MENSIPVRETSATVILGQITALAAESEDLAKIVEDRLSGLCIGLSIKQDGLMENPEAVEVMASYFVKLRNGLNIIAKNLYSIRTTISNVDF